MKNMPAGSMKTALILTYNLAPYRELDQKMEKLYRHFESNNMA